MDDSQAQSRLSHVSLRNRSASLFLIISLLCSCASSVRISGEEKVTLELYYETLCPYCSRFVAEYLYKIFENGLISITDLKLVPYGNAKIKSNGTIICQHGEDECFLNTIEACAIDAWPSVNGHFPFIYCVESLVHDGRYTEWETCFEKLGLDPTPVTECYESGRGKELELRYAAETNALEPPHKYVPWVVVDGQPLYDDYENFISYICKAYKGTTLPSACREAPLNTIPKWKIGLLRPVCYTDMTTTSKFSRVRSALTSWLSGINVAPFA